MGKIIDALETMATSKYKDANALLADSIYKQIDGYDQNHLADYVYTNDAMLRKLLGVKNLVEKDGNPEFTKEYFDLYKQGRAMHERDPYTKNDVNNQPLKEIPYYMEKFGVPKEHGEYTREQQAAFANSVSNLDRDELANLAWQEGFEGDADQMRNEISRAGKRLQRQLDRSGYNPDGSLSIPGKLGNLAGSFFAPRVSEAHQAGADATWRDKVGDAVEAGLNVVPGLGALGKAAGRVGSKIARIPLSIAANAFETATVPAVSNLVDMGLYSGTGDPRGKWDWERFGAQTAGTLGIKGAVKAGAGNAKNLLELRAGKDAGGSWAKDAIDIVEDIGNSTKDNIARRQLVMERKAEMARNPKYQSDVYLTSAQNKTGYVANPEDIIDEADFNIRKSEAERLAASQPNRTRYDKLTKKISEELPETLSPEQRQQFRSMNKEATNLDETFKKYDKYDAIVQLPDGRFVPRAMLEDNLNDQVGSWTVDGITRKAPDQYTRLQNYPDPSMQGSITRYRGNGSEYQIDYSPRDKVVRQELAKDKDFNRLISGQAKWEPVRDVAAQFIGNAGAREGWLGTGGSDLMGKREAALWNRQLNKLGSLVTEKNSAEDKRQMVDVIMNVMTFGRAIAPDEYAKHKTAYDAVFDRLGLEYQGVPTDPTTSQSMAR